MKYSTAIPPSKYDVVCGIGIKLIVRWRDSEHEQQLSMLVPVRWRDSEQEQQFLVVVTERLRDSFRA